MDTTPNEVGARVRALRQRLGLTQEQLSLAGRLERTEVVNVEAGRNLVTSHRMRCALARAFGLEQHDADAFIDGTLSLDRAVRLAQLAARRAGGGAGS